MPGIIYKFVKQFDDKFIYIIIKYKSKNFLLTASSNNVKLVVDDINNLQAFAKEHDLKMDSVDFEEAFEDFKKVFTSKTKIYIMYPELFEDIVKELQIGAELKDLKKQYSTALDNLKKISKKKKKLDERKKKYENYEKIRANEGKIKEAIKLIETEGSLKNAKCEKRIYRIVKDMLDIDVEDSNETKKLILSIRNSTIKEIEKDLLSKTYEVFCAYISKPIMRKSIYSPEGVFDYVDVDVSLSMVTPEEEIDSLIKEYKSRFDQDVLETVRRSGNYTFYGVPVEFIKIDKITLDRRTRTLHYLLCLKELG